MQSELVKDLGNTELVECYLGVNIFKIGSFAEYYHCDVWSEELNENVELESVFIDNLKEELSPILAYNFHSSLMAIKNHYNQKPDFNNPESNLENLRYAIETKMKAFLKDL